MKQSSLFTVFSELPGQKSSEKSSEKSSVSIGFVSDQYRITTKVSDIIKKVSDHTAKVSDKEKQITASILHPEFKESLHV